MEIKITLNTDHADDRKAFLALAEAFTPKKKLNFEEFQQFARENGFGIEAPDAEEAAPSPVAGPTAEVTEPTTEPTEEVKRVEEVKQETPSPVVNPTAEAAEGQTMTPSEFRSELNALRDKLGISTGTPLASQLAEYIRTVCAQKHGQPLPSKLSGEDLYKFTVNEVRSLVFDSVSGQFVNKVPS